MRGLKQNRTKMNSNLLESQIIILIVQSENGISDVIFLFYVQ